MIDIAVFYCFAAIFGVYEMGRSWLGPVHQQGKICRNPATFLFTRFYSSCSNRRRLRASLVLLCLRLIAGQREARRSRHGSMLESSSNPPLLRFLGSHAGHGRDFAAQQFAWNWLHPAHFYRTVGTCLQLLFFAEECASRLTSRDSSIVQPLAAISRSSKFFSTMVVWNSMTSVAGGWFF